MATPNPRDVSSLVKCVNGGAPEVLLAGGGQDGTEVDGNDVDRAGYNSALLLIPATASLGGGETLTIAVQLQHADDDGTGAADTYADLGAAYAVTSAVVLAAAPEGMIALSIDLSGVKQWVRAQVTSSFSAGTLDTAEVSTVWVLGGAEVLPAEAAGVERLPA